MNAKRNFVYGTGLILALAAGFSCVTYQASFINPANRKDRTVVRAYGESGIHRAVHKYYRKDREVEAVVVIKDKEKTRVESYQMQTWYHLARNLYEEGKYTEAVGICRKLLLAYPGQLDSYILLGLSYAGMGAHRQGEEVIAKVCAAHPDMVVKHRKDIGLFYLDLGDISSTGLDQAAAVVYYKKSLEILPRNRAALEGLAAVYCRLGSESRIAAEYGEAENYYRLTLNVMPGYPVALEGQSLLWARRGQTAFYANDPRAAIRAYKVALKLNPENRSAVKQLAALHELLARIYIKNREFDRAAHELARALSVKPEKSARTALREQLAAVRAAQKGDERLVDMLYGAGPVLTVSPMDQ